MRMQLVPMVVLLLANVGIDAYILAALRRRCRSRVPAMVQAVTALMLLIYIIVTLSLPRRSGSDAMLLAVMWMLFGYFSVYIPKLIFFVVDLVACLPRLFGKPRLRWLSIAGTVIAVAAFVGLWWSALVTRNSLHVNEVTIEIPDLPKAFDGYRIVQFSDAHVGTYGSDTTFVSRAADKINSLGGDVIVFTGDIVNMRSDELEPHTGPLSRLKARDGVVSILGNHDYGDYSDWPSTAAKEANMELLYNLKRRMNWRLLRDETMMLHRGGDSLALIGVENVGDPPFPTYGSLSRAYSRGLNDRTTKILLSHNPAHWSDSIAGHKDVNVALTLAGHTHAMQCEISGWSPAVFRYPLWGGLYSSETGQQLYVNIGLGTVGVPVRIGQAVPEITVLTLKQKHLPK